MFFYLSKVLAFLISPVTWIFALLIYSFITKAEGRKKKLRIAAIVIFYICSNSFLVDECFRAWEPVTADIDLLDTRYNGAIVLGGIGDIDMRLQKINFGPSADRLFQTLPLYYKGRVKKIIFSGGSGRIEFPEKREALFVQKYLYSVNFPNRDLIIESASRNTYENAVFTKKILDSIKVTGPFLLVTSAYHMPRAMAVFKKAGYTNITAYTTNRLSGIRRFTFDHLFIPNTGTMFALDFLIHEWVGYLMYKMKGYA